jgi:hypothetical protein
MESALMDAPEVGFSNVWKVDCDIERELNAANGEIERLTAKVAQLYEGAEEQKQRIKQLEDIIKRASSAFFCDGSDKETAVAMLTILEESR